MVSSREFLDRIQDSILIGDGAMGTMMQNFDDTSKPPELFVLEEPDILLEIHKQYITAGANLIETNTFGGNRLKLEKLGLDDKIKEINEGAVSIARKVAGNNCFVAGSVGPTGKMMKPYGELSIDKAREAFVEQISYLVDSGVDAIIIETMSDLAEIKAALLAAQDFDIPVIAQMTYTDNRTTLTGTPPEVVAIVLESLGADIIGVNCVAGLQEVLPILSKISKITNLPISVFPNAGLPICTSGKTSYPESPREFIKLIKELFQYNVRIIGGCCGTSPDYITAVKKEVNKYDFSQKFSHKQVNKPLYLSGNREYLELTETSPVYIIGEKLNPTGRKDIQKALKKGNWGYLRKIARDQLKAGAKLLDVNIGIPGIDKIEVMMTIIHELQLEFFQPLVIDSTNPDVLEAGLKEYIGKPLINSVNGDQAIMDKIFPLVKKYGTAVIGLTLDEKGIPNTVEARMAIARRIVREATKYGIDKKNIYIDTLALTVGSNQEQVMITLETLKQVKEELGVKTTLGASNISHGLPEREIINQVFLSMAMGYGLDLPIANPFDERIHNQIKAANLITNRDKDGEEFLSKYAVDRDKGNNRNQGKKGVSAGVRGKSIAAKKLDHLDEINEAVLNGDRNNIISLIERSLDINSPQDIIDRNLIPAIQEVGDLYDRGVYFLPQLLKSAETMQKAFDFLKGKLLTGEKHQSKATILLATVKGDIHDIGKNIVKTIFLNHGYDIIDLGANVDSELIVETAIEKRVDFVGLSSLMTTTLEEMSIVINLLKAKEYKGKTIIGGAVTSREFADEIGADIYASDALDGVRKVNEFLAKVNVINK